MPQITFYELQSRHDLKRYVYRPRRSERKELPARGTAIWWALALSHHPEAEQAAWIKLAKDLGDVPAEYIYRTSDGIIAVPVEIGSSRHPSVPLA